MSIIVAIRTDASNKIGSGHVMRCLSLAEKLRDIGVTVEFITRNYPGDLNKQINVKGFHVHLLSNAVRIQLQHNSTEYKRWSDIEQKIDAKETIKMISDRRLDWLIVDHYLLDYVWEMELRPYSKKIMVIDDLADRNHDCDILLDQTFGRKESDYQKLILNKCVLLLGSENALLRSDFKKLRPLALSYRKGNNVVKNIIVSMGSMDTINITPKVLDSLSLVKWKVLPTVNVVLTSNAPYLEDIRRNVTKYDFTVNIRTDEINMAQLMLESDLAIGSGGTTSWERCCLALPTILIILANNQQKVGENLAEIGATITIQKNDMIEKNISNSIAMIINDKNLYMEMCNSASRVCDGNGTKIISEKMLAVGLEGDNDI
jgi:UDP-2,4-diacetamido-2,4,6-trideoxy-beta-L-altropyranose hydrolase